jgi:anti-sigma factor RsiW
MPCPETLRTQAYIDGEVAGADAEAIERHIEGCADCQAFCADAATLSDTILRRLPRHAAPPTLRRRVKAMLDEEEQRRAPARPRTPAGASFWRGAFSGAGVTALAAGLAALTFLPPSAGTLADQVAVAHTAAMMRGRQIQVASTDHHTVKPWFAGRIAFSPPVADFTAQGFRLTGGRLDKVSGAPAAVVVYQHGKHEIDLFVWEDRGGALPATGLSHGYHSVFWKAGDLDFAAVSDTAASELASFANMVRAEPE